MGDRGRVVIPYSVREAQGLNQGDRLVLFEDEHGMTLMTLTQLEAKVQADFSEYPMALTDELISDRRVEVEHELVR